MKKTFLYYLKKYQHLLYSMVLLIAMLPAEAQQMVKGTVKSEEGDPLPGVTVVEKGTSNGTVTDINGNYSIEVSPETTLVFSYVGFLSQEFEVGNRTIIDVSLGMDLQQLSEIVVVGYGTVKKSDLTGSVVSIKEEDMTVGANVSVEQMMQGRAPGVIVESKSGEPGGAISVKIRGASSISAGNQPLYVIDGMPFNDETQITQSGSGFVASQNTRNPLNSLNPNDIASIEILKDASATAIYGSRGSNGVVLITTKNGQEGGIKVDYQYTRSLQQIAKKYDVLNANQYQEILNDILDAGGGPGNRVEDFQGEGVNWPEFLYRDGYINEHNLSISGGSKTSDFYLSLNNFNQEGILINSGLKRYNVKLNMNAEQPGKFKVGMNLNSSSIKNTYLSNGVGVNENAGALAAALYYDPTMTQIIDPFTGYYNTSPDLVIDNPLALAYHETATGRTFRNFGTAFAQYFITPDLSAKVKIAGDISVERRETWVGPETLEARAKGGLGSVLNATATHTLGEFTLNYDHVFGDHAIKAVSGVTQEVFDRFNNDANGAGYLYPDLQTNALGSGADSLERVGSSRTQYKLNSWINRVNYTFKEKYLLTASIRMDGSSRFGPNNKVGVFPSAAIGWKINEEAFMSNVTTISQLKFRASYGVIGNQAIPNYLYVSSFANGPGAVLSTSILPTLQPTRPANPNLQWESARQLSVGFDYGVLNARIMGTIDYYVRNTANLLLQVPQPPSSGFTTRWENLGKMRNSGLELGITAYILDQTAFKWEVTGNFSTLKNTVVDLGGVPAFNDGDLNFVTGVARVAQDTTLYSYYGYEIEGVWQTDDDFSGIKDNVNPGDWKFKDVNGDSTITTADKVILGKPFPDFTWGLTNTFSYKGITLQVYINASHGASLLNQNLVNTFYPIAFRNNRLAEPYLNRWTEDNPTNEYASFVNPKAQTPSGYQVNSKTVEDASYVRLQSIRLSYELPVNSLGIKWIRSLNVFVMGQNLATLTKYSGVDPAVNSFGNNNIPMDYNSYPFAKTYTFGVNVGL